MIDYKLSYKNSNEIVFMNLIFPQFNYTFNEVMIKLNIRSSLDWPRACFISSRTSPPCFYFTFWRTSKSSSIWPESGRKRRSPGSKKHMLIRSIDVRIRTRRDHFWTSSVLVELQQTKILEQKFEEMEWSAGPIGSRANNFVWKYYWNLN